MSQDLTQYATMNPSFAVSVEGESATHALVALEPLEQGYGHTLGNALRRVLLTSLPGTAVTAVKIAGVEHQFSGLEGLTEDSLELILNLKQMRIKSERQGKGVMRLSITGPAEVTAADVQPEAGYEIVNPDLYIATIAKGKKLEVELTIDSGIGYVMAGEAKGATIGEIPVDALFSPVIKVSYKIEATRVGRKTDYDRLILDITTDGTISPLTAVQQAAQMLSRQFAQVYSPVMPEVKEETTHLSPEEAEVMRLTVEELDLPTRIANALRKGGFKTVGDLVGAPRNVVAKVKNLGEKSVDVINEALQKKGATLGE